MNMNPIDYITRAVSTDESRYNLTSAYRDTDKLVATDGHRLHYSILEKTDSPHFLNPTIQGEYPNVDAVLTGLNTNPIRCAFKPKKLELKQLGLIAKLNPLKSCPVLLSGEDEHLTLKLESLHGVKASLTFETSEVFDLEWTALINLRYFIDALIPGQSVQIRNEHPTKALLIEHPEINLHAVIMPMRPN